MILDFPDINSVLRQQMEAGRFEEALAGICSSASALMTNKHIRGRALFLPTFDAMLAEIRMALLPGGREKWGHHRSNDVIVHLATEVYETGGHTRFIEDVAALLPEFSHVLILTDVAGSYRNAGFIMAGTGYRFATLGVSPVILRSGSHVERIGELDGLLDALRPRAISMLAHHYDVVAQAAVGRGSAKSVLFYHHGDYAPSLGATRKDIAHVDFTDEVQKICNCVNHAPSWLTPMTVRGSKRLVRPGRSSADMLTGLTCGNFGKFFGDSRFSYPQLLSALFAAGVSRMHHVGHMPAQLQDQIRGEVGALATDPTRLVFHGEVTSVCEAIHDLMPDFYMTSHPCGGGKSMLEAMSSGLPVVSTRKDDALLEFDVSKGSALVIEGLEDVAAIVANVRGNRDTVAERVFRTYQEYYSDQAFHRNCMAQYEWAQSVA